jgi:hypothetical protein
MAWRWCLVQQAYQRYVWFVSEGGARSRRLVIKEARAINFPTWSLMDAEVLVAKATSAGGNSRLDEVNALNSTSILKPNPIELDQTERRRKRRTGCSSTRTRDPTVIAIRGRRRRV